MPLRLLRLARTANQILQLERVRLDIVELVVLNLAEIPIGEGCDLSVQEVVSGVQDPEPSECVVRGVVAEKRT